MHSIKNDGSGRICRVIDSGHLPERPLGPQKMLKSGLHWVTTNHGNLTHLIFGATFRRDLFRPELLQTLCRAVGNCLSPLASGTK
jgi:hypothetical protein